MLIFTNSNTVVSGVGVKVTICNGRCCDHCGCRQMVCLLQSVYNPNGHNIYHCIIAKSGYSICHMAITSAIAQQWAITSVSVTHHLPQYNTKLGNNICHNSRHTICLQPQWSQHLPLHKVTFTPTPDTTMLEFVKINIFSNIDTIVLKIMRVNIFFRSEEAMLENW